MKKNDKQEILEAVQGLGQKIDGVDQRLSTKIDGVEQSLSIKIDGVEQNVTEQIGLMAHDVHGIDIRLKRVEALMVTKDYLDVKLADQRSDIMMNVKKKMPEWAKAGS